MFSFLRFNIEMSICLLFSIASCYCYTFITALAVSHAFILILFLLFLCWFLQRSICHSEIYHRIPNTCIFLTFFVGLIFFTALYSEKSLNRFFDLCDLIDTWFASQYGFYSKEYLICTKKNVWNCRHFYESKCHRIIW